MAEALNFIPRPGIDVADILAEALRKVLLLCQYQRIRQFEKTYRFERRHFGLLREVVQSVLHVVDRHSAIHSVKTYVGELGDTLVCAVPGLEVAKFELVLRGVPTELGSHYSVAVQ